MADAKAQVLQELRSIALVENPGEKGRRVHELFGVTADSPLVGSLLEDVITDAAAPDAEAKDADDEDGPVVLDVSDFVPVKDREVGSKVGPSAFARQMHVFLGSRSRFNDWFTDQIDRCGLIEGVDFDKRVLLNSQYKSRKGRPAGDFVLTLRAAKRVGMVSKGPRGVALREYFLDCEADLQAIRDGAKLDVAPPSPPASLPPPAVAVAPLRHPHVGLINQADVHLSLEECVASKGVADHTARSIASALERGLVEDLVAGTSPGRYGLHPTMRRVIFDRRPGRLVGGGRAGRPRRRVGPRISNQLKSLAFLYARSVVMTWPLGSPRGHSHLVANLGSPPPIKDRGRRIAAGGYVSFVFGSLIPTALDTDRCPIAGAY